MAKLKVNQFSEYEWESPEEELAANILNPGNVILIQNKLAIAATERAGLVHDVTNPYNSIQREAALAGEMAAYQFLLDTHFQTLAILSKQE